MISGFLHQFSKYFARNYARLGEYDTETESDGEHEDVAIARKIPHENYDRDSSKNDIAIMELERDVTFNGIEISIM